MFEVWVVRCSLNSHLGRAQKCLRTTGLNAQWKRIVFKFCNMFLLKPTHFFMWLL